VEIEGAVAAVAGYRVLENLVYGRFLYVDDLVTRAESKRNGFSGLLFDWLLKEARKERCAAVALDSGVQRFEAHRFYLRHGAPFYYVALSGWIGVAGAKVRRSAWSEKIIAQGFSPGLARQMWLALEGPQKRRSKHTPSFAFAIGLIARWGVCRSFRPIHIRIKTQG
jgi:hypothetical protein